MSEKRTHVATDIQIVDFYGDQVTAVLVPTAHTAMIYVPVKPLCDYLGLDWSAQRQRMQRDEVLHEGMVIITMPSASGDQSTACLPIDLLPGWLFGISTNRVKPTLRDKIIRYRRECFRALWEAFGNAILAPQSTPRTSGATLAFELATAVQGLAREQMQLEQRMNSAARWAKGIDARINALEVRLLPDAQISQSQAGELALAVKTLAAALEQHGQTNGYQRVYAERYRRFAVSSYKSLPQSRFDEAMQWLRSWYEEHLDTTHG